MYIYIILDDLHRQGEGCPEEYYSKHRHYLLGKVRVWRRCVYSSCAGLCRFPGRYKCDLFIEMMLLFACA